MRPKDPTPPEQRNGVIYRIPCKDCTMAYIGQSGRSLACRIKEHKRAVQNGDQNSSALAEHAWQQQHHVDWAAAEVLESTRNWYPRCMIESWHIHREANSMNRERGPLPHIYCSLLTEQKQRWRHHHPLCTVLCFCRRVHTTRMRSHINHTHLPSPTYCSVFVIFLIPLKMTPV